MECGSHLGGTEQWHCYFYQAPPDKRTLGGDADRPVYCKGLMKMIAYAFSPLTSQTFQILTPVHLDDNEKQKAGREPDH